MGCNCTAGYRVNTTGAGNSYTCEDTPECDVYGCNPFDKTDTALFSGVCTTSSVNQRTCTCPAGSVTLTTTLTGSAVFLGCKCTTGYRVNTTAGNSYCQDVPECEAYGCNPIDRLDGNLFPGSCGETAGLDKRVCTCPTSSTGTKTLTKDEPFPGCTCNAGLTYKSDGGGAYPYYCQDTDECQLYKCEPSESNPQLFKGNCSAITLNKRTCSCPNSASGTATDLVADAAFTGCSCNTGYRVATNTDAGYNLYCEDIPECTDYTCAATDTASFPGKCAEDSVGFRTCGCPPYSGTTTVLAGKAAFVGCKCDSGRAPAQNASTGYNWQCNALPICQLYPCDPSDSKDATLFPAVCSNPADNTRKCTCPVNSAGTVDAIVGNGIFPGCTCDKGYRPTNSSGSWVCADIDECATYGCDATDPVLFDGQCSNTAVNERTCTCPTNSLGTRSGIAGSGTFAGCQCNTGYEQSVDTNVVAPGYNLICQDINECVTVTCNPSDQNDVSLFPGSCATNAINERDCTCPSNSNGAALKLIASAPFSGCTCIAGYAPAIDTTIPSGSYNYYCAVRAFPFFLSSLTPRY